jgi:serine/threonine protein kinase
MLYTGNGGVLWKCRISDTVAARNHHVSTSEFVAVKTITFEICDLEDQLGKAARDWSSRRKAKRLIKEARKEVEIMQRLSHDHLVQFLGHEVVEERGVVRIAVCMELLDGDLAVYMEIHSLTVPEVVSFTRQSCLALVYLHANGFVHCDVKLENILINKRRGLVKLADFGNSLELEPGRTKTHVCDCALYTP